MMYFTWNQFYCKWVHFLSSLKISSLPQMDSVNIMIYTQKTYIVERWGRVKKQTRKGKRLQRYELRTQTTLTEPPCTWQSTWTSLYLTTEYLVWVWWGRRRELTWDTIWRWREWMWLDEFDSEGRWPPDEVQRSTSMIRWVWSVDFYLEDTGRVVVYLYQNKKRREGMIKNVTI
jgi:hypothetical protein